MPPRLRVYFGPEASPTDKSETIDVPLGAILPQLVEAVLTRRAWLDDFADEKLTISTDLYEVLLAARRQRPA